MAKNKKWWAVNSISEDVGEIHVFGDIATYEWWDEDVTFKSFNNQLEQLKNVKKIKLRINSYGGVVTEAVAMYNSLKRHALENNIETETYIEGIAASAATIVALAGDKIYMGDGTRFMIHNPSMGARGYSNDLRKAAEHLDNIKNDIVAIYEKKSNLSREKIEEYMNEEKFFSVEEAIEAGFVQNSIELSEEELKNNIYNFGDYEIINKYFPQFKNEEKPVSEGGKVIITNLSELKKQHPQLLQEFRNEIETEVKNKAEQDTATAVENAVKEERARIKALGEIKVVNKKHAEIVDKAKYEDPKNANEIIVELYNTGAFEANALIEAGKEEAKEAGVDDIPEGEVEVKNVLNSAIDKLFSKGGDK